MTGLSAKQGIIRHGANTVQNVLRVVGTIEDEGMWQSGVPCRPNWEGGQAHFSVQRGEKIVQVSPEDVLAHIFLMLKG